MAIAGKCQQQGPAVLLGAQGLQARSRYPVPDLGKVIARSGAAEGGKPIAHRGSSNRPSGGIGQLDHKTGEIIMLTRNHAGRFGGNRYGKDPKRQQQADHAASCFRLRIASSRAEKPGRTWCGVFCRPTSMQMFAG
jgi:hypothetical protein